MYRSYCTYGLHTIILLQLYRGVNTLTSCVYLYYFAYHTPTLCGAVLCTTSTQLNQYLIQTMAQINIRLFSKYSYLGIFEYNFRYWNICFKVCTYNDTIVSPLCTIGLGNSMIVSDYHDSWSTITIMIIVLFPIVIHSSRYFKLMH